MDKAYDPKKTEADIYRMWEDGGYFTPKKEAGKKPFTIILPPPNANANLHLGHAMYMIEDIMVRYHRMKGDPTLWLPGADHAGFETQFVFEKQLTDDGKSRFDYPRETLYKMIWDFVQKNRDSMESQLRRLGFSLDWSRMTFTLDSAIVSLVYKTFKKLYDDSLIYRGTRLVNFCTNCGTGFSDLEVLHTEKTDALYYVKYGPFVLATVRPETKFGDTAVAIHPKDKRYADWIGKEISFDGLTGLVRLLVVADEAVDPKFGTGVVKVTPAHDMTDYEIGKRHNLPLKQVIGFDGKLTAIAGQYAGLGVKAARRKVVEDLTLKGLIDHIDTNYLHTVGTCYKCGMTLEPLPMEQWFVKVRPLAENAIKAIGEKKTVFIPKRFEKTAIQWLSDFHDWNISRQIVWGIRIPAWKCETCDVKGKDKHWIVTDGKKPDVCPICGGSKLTQDPDVFDTWFSSGMWPFAALQKTDDQNDFLYFYPTSVMETGYDILPWWVCRMLMLGLYATGTVPFTIVYLHGLVRDKNRKKMSKSKGNVINPIEMVDKYGADALRLALLFGTASGSDLSISEDKIRGMRNFANKLWNITRFFLINSERKEPIPFLDDTSEKALLHEKDKKIIIDCKQLIADITRGIERYRFSDAVQALYNFTWHTLADVYIEKNKGRFTRGDTQALSVLRHVLLNLLKLLHPFIPFITETLWGKIPKKSDTPIIISHWPE